MRRAPHHPLRTPQPGLPSAAPFLLLTVGYNVVEGFRAVGSRVVAGSIALVGFGLDSFIEVFAAGLLLVHFGRLVRREDGHEFSARRLRVRALAPEAKETMICAGLSLVLLLGLGLNAVWGLWWADPAAALAMGPLHRQRRLGSSRRGSRRTLIPYEEAIT